MHGVAFFKDGRVASKEFIYNSDSNKGSGPFFGYSTCQFEDGSTITARFGGTQRAGQPIHGEYTVLSGSGVYAGAKGTGSFDGVAHKLTGANLLNHFAALAVAMLALSATGLSFERSLGLAIAGLTTTGPAIGAFGDGLGGSFGRAHQGCQILGRNCA